MYFDSQSVPRRSTSIGVLATLLVLALTTASNLTYGKETNPDQRAARAQLSVGYSLLYQEADGIPKLRWLLMFKDKPEEMGRVTSDLVDFYQKLAQSMERLSKQYPAMRLDADTMPKIETDTRKAIGEDLAKDMAPLVGKTGKEFEREALLLFYNSLDEQRHLTGVMIGIETDSSLRKFLETTKTQLEVHYAKVGALLKSHYFVR